jgi:hypothetical protein
MNELEESAKNKIKYLTAQLYENVHVGEPPKNAPYITGGYYLDQDSYENCYQKILRVLYSVPNIQGTWSEQALREQLRLLIVELGKNKEKANSRDQTPEDILTISMDWYQNFWREFEEQDYYAPIIGLVVEIPFTIGKVSFWPLKDILPEINVLDDSENFSTLSEHRDCLASARIKAESIKCAEILRSQVEETLNILRYIGALERYNQPTKHIYLAGKEPKRTSYVLAVDDNNHAQWIGDSLYYPIPFIVKDGFHSIVKSTGLWEISSWLINPTATPLQHSLLLAIQWFGDATQELRPLQAFMKYYIAIESLLKKETERAKRVLPKRAAYMLNERDSSKIIYDLKLLIDERNAVFHEGSPNQDPPEVLARITHQIARNLINSIVHKVRIAHIYPDGHPSRWNTKEEMLNWIDNKISET